MSLEFVVAHGGTVSPGPKARLGADRPCLSPIALGLVVLVHLGALAALVSLRVAPLQTPTNTMMVEVIRANTDEPKSPEIKPVKPAIAPATPPAVAPQRARQRPVEAPVLATENPLTSTASEVPKVEKTLAPPQAPQSAQPLARQAAPVVSEQSAPRFDADYLQNPAPAYPPLSRRSGEEGKVVLKVYVQPTGLVSSVEIQKSSGFERLDKSAISAVSRWKFVPAKQGTEAVGAWVLVPIVYSLKD